MQPTPQSASSTLPQPGTGFTGSLRCEDIVYQAVTIVAILLVLGSVWVF
jgi:hypothetical protein